MLYVSRACLHKDKWVPTFLVVAHDEGTDGGGSIHDEVEVRVLRHIVDWRARMISVETMLGQVDDISCSSGAPSSCRDVKYVVWLS